MAFKWRQRRRSTHTHTNKVCTRWQQRDKWNTIHCSLCVCLDATIERDMYVDIIDRYETSRWHYPRRNFPWQLKITRQRNAHFGQISIFIFQNWYQHFPAIYRLHSHMHTEAGTHFNAFSFINFEINTDTHT